MTQTNDSELEKWDKAIADEIENQGRDMEIAINNVLNIVHELRDQAFAAGEKNGIAKAEKVTRFEVIDHKKDGKGRVVVEYDVKVELSYQDDDRTLKVFLTDR